MNNLVLGPLLRYVDETSATMWVETQRPAQVSVLGATSSTFCVEGRSYALVIVENLEPGTCTPYEVHVDKARVWPPEGSDLPASVIPTPTGGGSTSILAESCRADAPHDASYILELLTDHEGRGVDTLWAHARRMRSEPPETWPDLLLLVGDQTYADDSSPRAKERIVRRRNSDASLASEIVADFEE